MRERVKAFLKKYDMCVLATAQDGRPHCSLMAYVTDEGSEWIYMVTQRDTKKFSNHLENPEVSLLVDNRCEGMTGEKGRTQALTVHGRFYALDDADKCRAIFREMLARHPHMKDFLNRSEAEIIAVRVHSFLFLDGISDAHYVSA